MTDEQNRAREAQGDKDFDEAQSGRDQEEIIKLVRGEDRTQPPQPESTWEAIKDFIGKNIAVIVTVIVVASLFVADNILDSERQEAVRDDISAERRILDGQVNTLTSILCLADRVDLLMDIELDGLRLEDLTPEEEAILRDSCRDEDDGDSEGQ